jgi:hypothetical protein
MSPRTRDNFTETTKRILAERANWRCGFPSCTASTVGPSEADDTKSITLGEAAHITAAASGGPRYDERLSEEQRRAVTNGIWMCRQHARLIDADENNYSPDTLRLWKIDVEQLAAQELRGGGRATAVTPSTLVMFGFRHVFHAHWVSGGDSEWRFDCRGFVVGNERSLVDEIENFGGVAALDRFVVVESQGDGRMLSGSPRWERHSGVLRLTLLVAPRAPRMDPTKIGWDLKLGDDGDLAIENGDLAVVSGINAAIQNLSMVTSMRHGEWSLDPRMGSLCARYHRDHRADLLLVGRLFRLEFARLATIPISAKERDPVFGFIWRVEEVRIVSAEPKDERLSVAITLEWANSEHWSGNLSIYVD